MRSHITKLVLITTVWLGMALYLVRPVQAEATSNSFSSWLNTVVKSKDGDSDSLRKQLYKLKESDHSLNTLIQKASEIVSRHNDDFNLPLGDDTADSEKVFDLLVWEWNSFQTGNGMGKASIPTNIKSNFHPTIDKFAHGPNAVFVQQVGHAASFVSSQNTSLYNVQPIYQIIPLSGGTAIGAP